MNTFREIKEYFTFSSTERNGIIVLSIIIVIILIFNLLIPVLFSPEPHKQEKLLRQIAEISGHFDTINKRQKVPAINKDSLFPFNPNNLAEDQWKKLGLTESQIEVIKNYENAGGKFYYKSDLKKIYSISEEVYKKLKPFIQLPEKGQRPEKTSPNTIEKIEINSADSAALTLLPGIGPVFAGRIIKYRNLLGGFYDKNQLLEVYGFDSVYFNKSIRYITTDTNLIKKININTATFREIVKHPYINYELTKVIVSNRNQLLNPTSFYKLLKSIQINDSLFQKIEHYIKFW